MAVRVDILPLPGRGMWPTRLRPAVDAPALRMLKKGEKTMLSVGNLLWFILGGIWMITPREGGATLFLSVLPQQIYGHEKANKTSLHPGNYEAPCATPISSSSRLNRREYAK